MDLPAFCPECEKCLLCYQPIKHPGLGGRGNLQDPKIVGIGEAPGPDEDLEGKIFCGKAGKELEFLLGDKISRMYLTNILKCLPLKNVNDPSLGFRTPEKIEIDSCRTLLFKELRAFDPNKVVLMPMGSIAYQALFGVEPDPGILAVAGLPRRLKINESEFLVVPNVHPSWVARSPKIREGKFLGILNRAWNTAKEGNLLTLNIENKGAEYEILSPERAIQELEFVLSNKNDLQNIIIDLETTSLDYWKAEIIMINFAHALNPKGFSIPLRVSNTHHHPEKYPYEVPMIPWDITPEQVSRIRNLFVKIIEGIPLAGHNLKYDLLCLLWNKWIENLDKIRVFDDTMILIHLIYNQRLGNLKLKDCCKKIFDIHEDWDKKVTAYLSLFRLVADKENYANLPTSILGEYGALDAYYNRKLHEHLLENIPSELEHLREFITYLTIVFTEVEISGIALDKDVHGFLSDSYGDMLDKMSQKTLSFSTVKEYIESKIVPLREANQNPRKKKKLTEEEMVGEVFTMTKRLALIDIMFDKKYLGMPVLRKTKGGKDGKSKVPATDQEAIKLLELYPNLNGDQRVFINNLADYRKIDKLISTYVAPVMDRFVNGLYRQEFMIPGTVTGRLSSGFHILPRDSDIKRMYCSRWRDQGGLILGFDFCLAPDTKVLTFDLRWKKIKDIEIGEELVGFDEELRRRGLGRARGSSKFRRSVVENKSFLKLPCYLVKTERGEFISSADHSWVVRRKLKKGGDAIRQWIRTEDLKVGDPIGYVCDPWEEDVSHDGGYLAGFFDGEGWLSDETVGFGQNEGNLIKSVLSLLKEKGFEPSKSYSSKKGKCKKYVLKGNRTAWKFLGSIRPKRLLEKSSQLWENKRTWSSNTPIVKILSIEFLGEREVVGLRTSTKTFIAEGFLSHNSQLELRVLACLAQEPKMIEAFINHVDIHAKTGGEIAGKSWDKISPDERSTGKTTNFAIVYGKTADTLKDDLHVTRERAQQIIDSVLGGYDKVAAWMKEKHKELEDIGGIKTVFGREIPIPEYYLDGRNFELEAQRKSVNYPIQCLEKNTLIPLVSGEIKTIEELSFESKEQYVYCYDLNNKNISVSKATKFFKSGEVSEMIRVHLDNDKYLQVTREHLFLLRSGVYKSASDLIVGDSLMPFDIRISKKGYKQVFDFQKIPGLRLWRIVYKLVAKKYLGKRNKGDNIHHIDENKINDVPKNLEYLLPEDHIFIHADRSIGKKNPLRKLYPCWNISQKEAVRKVILERLRITGNVTGMNHEKFKDRLSQSWKESYNYRVKCLKKANLDPKTKRRKSVAQKLKFNNPLFCFKYGRTLIEKFPKIKFDSPDRWDKSIKNLIFNRTLDGRSAKYSKFFLSVGLWGDFVSFLKTPNNHKVTKIEAITFEKPEPVYDIEVPEFHNFAVNSGIFVHNSTASDLVNSGIARLHKKFKALRLQSIILAAIHDAAYNDLKPGELFILIALMKKTLELETMQMYPWLICPIEIDISMGTSMGSSIKMEVEELDENHALMVGKGLRKDFNMLMHVGESAYNMKFYLEKEKEVDKDYFTIDRVLGDVVEWKGKLEISNR